MLDFTFHCINQWFIAGWRSKNTESSNLPVSKSHWLQYISMWICFWCEEWYLPVNYFLRQVWPWQWASTFANQSTGNSEETAQSHSDKIWKGWFSETGQGFRGFSGQPWVPASPQHRHANLSRLCAKLNRTVSRSVFFFPGNNLLPYHFQFRSKCPVVVRYIHGLRCLLHLHSIAHSAI